MSRQIILDTETTGLSAVDGDRVIEIGCVELLNRRLTGRNLHLYLNPDRPSHPDALRVHGLTEEFLADKPRFPAVAQRLLDYLAGAELIIHNAAFDLGFLDAELDRIGRPPLKQQVEGVLDTLLLARETWPGKSASLDALCKRLEVDNSGRQLHGALLDAELLAEVYLRMTRGQDSLVIDALDTADVAHPAAQAAAALELSRIPLIDIQVSAEEAAAHEALRAELDKACGGLSKWSAVMA